MKINSNYINDYEQIIKTTNLQKGYQEFVKFFRSLKTYLEKEMHEFTFTNNIVENNMDYSYFQFTGNELKEKGLKIVIAFVHKNFDYQIWLSGVNRKKQNEYYNKLKNKQFKYELTTDSNRIDYILRTSIINEFNYEKIEKLFFEIKKGILEFIDNIYSILQ